jgi:hypothetical protein
MINGKKATCLHRLSFVFLLILCGHVGSRSHPIFTLSKCKRGMTCLLRFNLMTWTCVCLLTIQKSESEKKKLIIIKGR